MTTLYNTTYSIRKEARTQKEMGGHAIQNAERMNLHEYNRVKKKILELLEPFYENAFKKMFL